MGIVGFVGFGWIGHVGRYMGCRMMGYFLAGASMVLKLGLAHDGDIFGAAVVAVLSPALFLGAAGPKSR